MEAIAAFFNHNIIVVYFFYGLAFFSMGLVVLLESGRTSALRMARAMGPLAGFGILHGLHEWFEMFQRIGAAKAANIPAWLLLDEIRIPHLVISFLLLVVFGVRLLYAGRREGGDDRLFALVAAGALFVVWLGSVVLTNLVYRPDPAGLVDAVDVLARYMLGIPGALVAAWAIFLEQRTFEARGMTRFARDLRRAAVALIFYGVIGQAFPRQSLLFPSTIVNSNLFVEWFIIPPQVFRAAMAILMAFFIIRALRAFDLERQQRLTEANDARMAAQQEALEVQQQARREMEELNQELQEVVQNLTLLFEFSRSLATTLDQETLLQRAVDKLVRNVPRLAGGMVFLNGRHDTSLQPLTSAGYDDVTADEAEMVQEQARVLGRYVLATGEAGCQVDGEIIALGNVDRLRSGRLPENFAPQDRSGMLGVPLVVQDEVVGSLVLSARPGGPCLAVSDLSLIGTVAGQLSIALANARLYREVQAREAMRGELLQRVVSAQERERQRIARELHDSTGQILTGLGLGVAAARESIKSNPELAARQLEQVRGLSDQALQELRDVIRDLRPSVLDDLGLVPALHGQVEAFSARTGIDAELAVSGRRRRVQSEVETVVFRIAQEALTNVAKHAEAEHVNVRLSFTENMLDLTVQDDGQGFDPAAALRPGVGQRRAWGLLGMQERVSLVGGDYHVTSHPGMGTTVHAQVPLFPEDKKVNDGG